MPLSDQPSAPGSAPQREPEQANPRVVVAVLAVIGLAALILGFFQILNSIRLPFSPNRGTNQPVDALATTQDDKLRSQDTDSDQISDLDELTLTHTSPFLKDSDSDGVDDRAELSAGTDPNCPPGRVCGLAIGGTNSNTNAGLNTNAAANTNGASTKPLAGSQTAEQIRQTLKDAGAPAYVVDNTDDATLLSLYNSVLGEAAGSTTTDGNTNGAAGTDVLESLRGLPVSDIRELLKGGGADETLLNQVDDASLKSIFTDALNQEQQTPQTP